MAQQQEITGVLDAYAAAVLAKDADALVGLYANDVRVFDLWGQWAYDGATAWRRPVEEWFGSLGDERIVVGGQRCARQWRRPRGGPRVHHLRRGRA